MAEKKTLLLLLLWQSLPDPRHAKCGREKWWVKIACVRPDQSARTNRVKHASVNPRLPPYVSVLGTGQLPEQAAELKPHRRCTVPLGWEEPNYVGILGSTTSDHSPYLSLPPGLWTTRWELCTLMQCYWVFLSPSLRGAIKEVDLDDYGSDNESWNWQWWWLYAMSVVDCVWLWYALTNLDLLSPPPPHLYISLREQGPL